MSKRKEHPTKTFKGNPKRQRTMVAEVQKVIRSNEEKKNIDINAGGSVQFGTTTASVGELNLTAQGAGATQRLGRRFTMTSLEYRWAVGMAPTTTGASPLRLCIVYDKQTNGAVPTTSTVFQTDVIHTMMNLNNNRRFKVLVDEIIDCVGAQGPQSIYVKGFRDFTAGGTKKGLEVECANTNNGDITDIQTGAIYSFVWQNGNLAVANPTSQLFTRIRFTDA